MMFIKKYCITFVLLLSSTLSVFSQKNHMEICVDFRVNKTVIDTTYLDNRERMRELKEFLHNFRRDSLVDIVHVSFLGAASPEGSDRLNRKLAQGRLSALENFIRNEVNVPDSLVSRADNYIPWEYLKSQVEDSDLAYKDEVLAILNEEGRLADYLHPNSQVDVRILKLKALDGGKVWKQLHNLFFERMRNACVVFVVYKPILPVVEEPELVLPVDTIPAENVLIKQEPPVQFVPGIEVHDGRWHLKTNIAGLAVGLANLAVEWDFAKRWSLAIPVYYSALNYFSSKVKFRALGIQPELRYWFSESSEGWFTGAHVGYSSYNVAVGQEKRYQDHAGKNPLLGGGLSIGYRMPLTKSHRWDLEFVLGAGVYDLHYDVFYNVENGKHIDEYHKTYWGLDNIAINLSYRFNLKKCKK